LGVWDIGESGGGVGGELLQETEVGEAATTTYRYDNLLIALEFWSYI